MSVLLAILVGIPLAWHLAMVAGTYWDAGRVGMSRPKWTAIVLLVPLFGFFAYLFERIEREEDAGEDPYSGSVYNVHERHLDDEDGSGGRP